MTLSIPINSQLEEGINKLIKLGVASNKADLARKALERFIEDEAVSRVLKAEQEANEGKILYGDLDTLSDSL